MQHEMMQICLPSKTLAVGSATLVPSGTHRSSSAWLLLGCEDVTSGAWTADDLIVPCWGGAAEGPATHIRPRTLGLHRTDMDGSMRSFPCRSIAPFVALESS